MTARVVAHLNLQSDIERKLETCANFAYGLLNTTREQHSIWRSAPLRFVQPNAMWV